VGELTVNSSRWLAALVAVSTMIAGCATPSTTQQDVSASVEQERSLDPIRSGLLDETVPDAMKSAGIPGAMVGIWSRNGEYVKAFGVADTATGSPMRTDFYSRIGSVTKTFTATAALKLVDEGGVGLDDPIAFYLDGVPNGEAITVRQLLTMSSGLTDYTKVPGFEESLFADPRREFTPTELLDLAFTAPAQFPPGEKFEYSNTNYILLGLLVERASGTPLAEYLAENILGPLNLDNTALPAGTRFASPHAPGYTESFEDGGPPQQATDWSASFTWAAGAMTSTLEDMRNWMPALATGALLSPELQRQRLETIPEPGGPADFGYGMGVFTIAGWIGHNGSVPGYQTVAVYLPERETTLVVMINTDIPVPGGGDPSEALATAITSVITPDNVYKF
jgi:D-alanyl-D-alanine carboxypeptidase